MKGAGTVMPTRSGIEKEDEESPSNVGTTSQEAVELVPLLRLIVLDDLQHFKARLDETNTCSAKREANSRESCDRAASGTGIARR